MYVVCVNLWVHPESREAFLEATLKNSKETRLEKGNLRFDILNACEDLNHFFLYEVYLDETAFKAHQQTQHYFCWRNTVAEMMAQPRQGIRYQSIFPDETPISWKSS